MAWVIMCEFIQRRVHQRTYRPVVCTWLKLILKHSIGEPLLYNRDMNINELVMALKSDGLHLGS